MNIKKLISDIITIEADGQIVYQGSDQTIVARWYQYFNERTSWSEIHRLNSKGRASILITHPYAADNYGKYESVPCIVYLSDGERRIDVGRLQILSTQWKQFQEAMKAVAKFIPAFN